MTINGKPIAVMFALQFGAAIIFDLGGIAGQHLMRKLNADIPPLGATHLCITLGLWPLAVPLIWVILVFFRAHQDAPLHGNVTLVCLRNRFLCNRGCLRYPCNNRTFSCDVTVHGQIRPCEISISNSQHSNPMSKGALPGLAGVFLLTHARPEGNERVSRWSKCAV
jgi:hypothetical protein